MKIEKEPLLTRETHFARALRIAGIGSVLRDYRTGRVEWSDVIYRILGLDPNVGPDYETYLSLVHPDDVVRVETARERALHGWPDPSFEYRIIRPNGELRVLRREGETVCDHEGRPIFRVTTMKDITEQRNAEAQRDQLERQLQHAQKLESLGTLAGGIAHELNNLLVPILALSKIVLKDLPKDSLSRGDLETIFSAGERGRELVQQVLAFSRTHDASWELVSLADVARAALRMLRSSLPATIRIDEDIEDVPLVIGDFGQLHQVVVVLMTNAAQAIGAEPGRIILRLALGPPMPIGMVGAPAVSLSISDTGCGMDESTIGRIFEPFYTTKPVGQGTGLGLSIAHGIVDRHGGVIEVRSTPNVGTEFAVLLPPHRSDEIIADPKQDEN